jgi:YggT family protein
MRTLFNLLAGAVNFYSLIIFLRIILTWFSGVSRSGPALFLARITDPYLNWFRRFPFLRIGFLDLSPVAGMAVLSLVGRVFLTFAAYGSVRAGIILVMLVQALWSILSFVLGFIIIVLGLRLFAYLTSQDIFRPFWRIVDTISQPILYRINRILFGRRIVKYLTGILVSLAVLVLLFAGGKLLSAWAVKLLLALPF